MLSTFALPNWTADSDEMYGKVLKFSFGVESNSKIKGMYQDVYGVLTNIYFEIDNETIWYLDGNCTLPHIINVNLTFALLSHYNKKDGVHFWN